MRTPIQWQQLLPTSLVIGQGSYSDALSATLGSGTLAPAEIETDPEADADGKFPQVFGDLKWVFVVVLDNMSASEALRSHDAAWRWVDKLAPAGEEQELAFIFVLPPGVSNTFQRALAVGLGLSTLAPPYAGHVIWRATETLRSLVDLLPQVGLRDLPPLRSRLKVETKHAILGKLREAVARKDETLVRETAREVVREFSGSDYLLDLFCRQPSHRNGNLLRNWLRNAVTGSVTPDGNNDYLLLSEWLK